MLLRPCTDYSLLYLIETTRVPDLTRMATEPEAAGLMREETSLSLELRSAYVI